MDEETALTTTEEQPPALTDKQRVSIIAVLTERAKGLTTQDACKKAGLPRSTWYLWEKQGLISQVLSDEKAEAVADLRALIVSEMRDMVLSMIALVKEGSNESARVKAFQVLQEFWQQIQAEDRASVDDFLQQVDKWEPVRIPMPQMAQVNLQVNVDARPQSKADDDVVEGEVTPIGEEE